MKMRPCHNACLPEKMSGEEQSFPDQPKPHLHTPKCSESETMAMPSINFVFVMSQRPCALHPCGHSDTLQEGPIHPGKHSHFPEVSHLPFPLHVVSLRHTTHSPAAQSRMPTPTLSCVSGSHDSRTSVGQVGNEDEGARCVASCIVIAAVFMYFQQNDTSSPTSSQKHPFPLLGHVCCTETVSGVVDTTVPCEAQATFFAKQPGPSSNWNV